MEGGPQVTRVRHEIKRRTLTVARVEQIALKMVRVVLRGEELNGFSSLGFDDHVKLFFPADAPGGEPEMRDFTPRHFDSQAGELWIDFFLHDPGLHDAGPAAGWASQAAVGQSLVVGGPRGSAIIALEGIHTHLFIGDETALPAIARRLAELPASARALAIIEVEPVTTWPDLKSRASLEVITVARNEHAGSPAQALIDELRTLRLPADKCFAWVALEMQSARAVRKFLRDERQFGKDWIKAAAYWQRGAVGTHERIED
jgi:NADPH-dependent ferric siderophore reductase